MDIPSNIDEQTARRIIELSVARPDMGDRSIAERLGLSRHAVRTVRSSVGLRTDHRADYARIVAALKRWPYLGMHRLPTGYPYLVIQCTE